MLIYSVLSIPLYRIICTTSTIGAGTSSSMGVVIGTTTSVIVLGNSVHYFINTEMFVNESFEMIMACSCYMHDMLNGLMHYTMKTQNSYNNNGVPYAIGTILLRFSVVDMQLNNIFCISHYICALNNSMDTLTCNHVVVEIENILYKTIAVFDNNLGMEMNNGRQEVYEVLFLTRCSTKGIIEFYALQERVFVLTGETTLVFFRVQNLTTYNISCLTVYFLYPDYLSIYSYKLQCFCFEISHLESNEVLDLPVLFYISHDIVADVRICNKFIVYYVLFPLEKIQIDNIGIVKHLDFAAPLQII